MDRRKLTPLVVVTLLLIGFGLWWWASGSVSTDDAQLDGTVSPISARVTGNVLSVRVHEGQVVKAGDLLVQIDPKDYEVALAKAQADLADAQGSLRSAQADVPATEITSAGQLGSARAGQQDAASARIGAERQLTGAKARLDAAKARLAQAEANATRASQDLARYKALVEKDEISRQQYDAAVATATANLAEADAQKATLVEAEQNVKIAQQTIDQAGARVEQASANYHIATTGPQMLEMKRAKAASAAAVVAQKQALLEQAQLNLAYCNIVAPVDGIVGKKTAEIGQNVGPGQQLMAVVPVGGLFVTANFKETELRHMQVGQKVKIEVDSTGKSLTGVVEAIGGATGSRYSLLPPENATGNYVKVVQRIPVRIKLDPNQDSEGRLRVGMSVVPKVSVR